MTFYCELFKLKHLALKISLCTSRVSFIIFNICTESMEICKSNGLGSMCWVKINDLSKQFIKHKKINGVRKAILKKIIFNFSKENGRYIPNAEFFVKRLSAGSYSLHNKVCINKLRLFQNKIQNGFIISKEEAVYLKQNNQLNINIRCIKEFMNITGVHKIQLLESDFKNFYISLTPSTMTTPKQEEGGGEEIRENNQCANNHINMDNNNFYFVPQKFQSEMIYENIPVSIYPPCETEPMDDLPSTNNIIPPSSNHQFNENLTMSTSNYIQSSFLPDPSETYFIMKMECNTGEGNIPNYSSLQFPTMMQVPSLLLSSPPPIPVSSAQITTSTASPEQLPVPLAHLVQSSTLSTPLQGFSTSLSATPSMPSISSSSMSITDPVLHSLLPAPSVSTPAPLLPSIPSVPKPAQPPASVTGLPVPPVQSPTSSTSLQVFPISLSATPSTPFISSSMHTTYPVLYASTSLSEPVVSSPAHPVSSIPSVIKQAISSAPVPYENPVMLNLLDTISDDEGNQVQNNLDLIESKFTPEDFLLGI